MAPTLNEIYNFLLIDEQFATAGQPTPAQLATIKEAGYEMIINLGMADSPRAVVDEDRLVAAQGLAYVAIPVVWEAPTAADLEQSFQVMQANQDKKRFVHCIANMRVSAFTFLYRVIQQGMPVDEARQALDQIWQPNPIWQNFIEDELAKHGLEWE